MVGARLAQRAVLASAVGPLASCGTTTLDATDRVEDAQVVPSAPVSDTFTVSGRFLHDRCGQQVVLRGVNEMVVWSEGQDGVPEFVEIAKTGANAVRITWTSEDPVPALSAAISNALDAGLIPLVELHDGQGDWSRLPRLVDFWASAETVAMVATHEHALLVGIGSGVGGEVDGADWEAGYVAALERLRGAGIRTPIVIDAPSYGQDIQRLLASGPTIRAADPLDNVLFGVGVWSPEVATACVSDAFGEAVALELPLIVTEFSAYDSNACPEQTIDYTTLLAAMREHEIGWFAWSWGGVSNGGCETLNMTTDGTLAGLVGWGYDVALGDPNGISSTAVRPASIAAGTCLGR